MPFPIIQDNAVIDNNVTYRYGEASDIPLPPMHASERIEMMRRLSMTIVDELMVIANDQHQANYKNQQTGEVNLDYITRFSTNEFFFYTQEPLTLEEFELLQNQIAEKAENLPSGIHLILGSFAVKTKENLVMNVTPYIQCGKPYSFNFILKNNTSAIDVTYKEPQASSVESKSGEKQADAVPLLAFDITSKSAKRPEIKIHGITHRFTFNNIIVSKTPRGNPFLTIIDICLDHKKGVGITNVEKFLTEYSAAAKLAISHVLISNTLDVSTGNALEPLMHVDPKYSSKQCKGGAEQKVHKKALGFGKRLYSFMEVDAKRCCSLEDASLRKYLREQEFSRKTNELLDTLYNLKFSEKDQPLKSFVNTTREAINRVTRSKEQPLIDELNSLIAKLTSSPILEIQTQLQEMKKNLSFFDLTIKYKIHNIEKILNNLPLEERGNLNDSVVSALKANGIVLLDAEVTDTLKQSTSELK